MVGVEWKQMAKITHDPTTTVNVMDIYVNGHMSNYTR